MMLLGSSASRKVYGTVDTPPVGAEPVVGALVTGGILGGEEGEEGEDVGLETGL